MSATKTSTYNLSDEHGQQLRKQDMVWCVLVL